MSAESATTSPALALNKCGAVVLDVAGTTTSINFIKDTLFPFVTKQAEEYLKANWDVNEIKEAVKLLKDEELDLEKAVKLVQQMTEENSDNKGLKTIQGLIYKKGYESGELKAHVFEDVANCLELWGKSRKIAIYSTGSIEAQKQLFAHTEKGDLSAPIHKYFDQTVIGSKTESGSYEKITKDLEMTAEQLLFITDNVEEAEAAKTAGLQVAVVKREGNAYLPSEIEKKFTIISSFSEINFEAEEEGSGKRKIDEENVEAPPTKVAKTEDSSEKTAKPDEVVEEKAAAEKKKEEEKMEVDGAALSSEKKEEVKEPEKTEMETEKVEEKIPEKTEEKEINVDDTKEEKMEATEEKKSEKAQPVEEKKVEDEKKVEETKPEKVEESKEKPVEEEKIKEAEKVDTVEEASSKSEKKDEEAKENGGEEKTKETEKENKSELANGVGENGSAAASTENGQEKVNGSTGNEESDSKEKAEATEEIKTKKIEPESTEKEAPATVSVEV